MRKVKENLICLIISVCTCSYAAAQNAAQYTAFVRAGHIILNSQQTEINISTSANDTLPIIKDDAVYYASNNVNNSSAATGNTIMVYNLADATRQDILRSADNEDYTFKDAIVNMLFNKAADKLYFSTVNSKGSKNFITWIYDTHSKRVSSYKDGIITGIDGQDKQTIIFYGADSKGKYTLKNIYATDGTLTQSSGKEYTAY